MSLTFYLDTGASFEADAPCPTDLPRSTVGEVLTREVRAAFLA